MRRQSPSLALTTFIFIVCAATGFAERIGNHEAKRDPQGMLLPWTSWTDAIDREMAWYAKCPIEHGYPKFVWMTFMEGDYTPVAKRTDFIPATQNGMGIISYLKYYAYKGKSDAKSLEIARSMGDYLVKESLTPDTGKYPKFTRSTGWREKFPQAPDCGRQNDHPYEIEPDKGGIAGYALVLLYEETKDARYLTQALQNAKVLAANMREGTATAAPWPFRVDYRTGEPRGEVNGNMSFNLRLLDKLIEHGHDEFKVPRERLWKWIVEVQLPDLKKEAVLWGQFFEDHENQTNRTAWSPLNLARYMIEKKEALDPEWKTHAHDLIEFVNGRFITSRFGVPVCGEQDEDKNPWGGILSTYGGVLAMYCAATGSDEYKSAAIQALNFCIYAINDDGCPRDSALKDGRGGWQEDAHTDKVHNFIDAFAALPQFAK